MPNTDSSYQTTSKIVYPIVLISRFFGSKFRFSTEDPKSKWALRRIKNHLENLMNGVFVISGTKSNDLGGWGVTFWFLNYGHLTPTPTTPFLPGLLGSYLEYTFFKQLHFGPAEPQIFENQRNSACSCWVSKWKNKGTCGFFGYF